MYNPPVDISDNRWSKDIHNALPAFMNQHSDSNNQKMLNIYANIANQYKNDLLDITSQTLAQNAQGAALDRLCKDWGVSIIDENDDEFKRFQLRFQMLSRILSPSDLKDAIAFIFNISTDSFNIVSTAIKTVKVVNLPFNFDTGDKTNLKKFLVTKYINEMLPPEFQLAGVEYQKWTNAKWSYYIWAEHTIFKNVEQEPISYEKYVSIKNTDYVATNHSKNVIQERNDHNGNA